MMINFRNTILLCSLFCLESFGQEFKTFERLRSQGDSVQALKQHSLSAKFYEQALALPEDQKPEIFGIIYYDLACKYALSQQKEKALDNLEKSFKVYNAKRKQNPVSASHITSDADLDFVRDEIRFQQLIKEYYKGIDTQLLYAKEIDYYQLLTLIEYLGAEEDATWGSNPEINISNKTIYWKKKNDAYVFNDRTLRLPNINSLQTKTVFFENCDFQLNLILSGFLTEKQDFRYKGFEFTNCNFHGKVFLFDLDFKEVPAFKRSIFSGNLQMWINADEGYGVDIEGCSLHQVDIFLTSKSMVTRHSIKNNYSADSADFRLSCQSAKSIFLLNNKFSEKNIQINLNTGETESLVLKENEFSNLKIIGTNVKSEFDFQMNTLAGKLLMVQSYFSDQPANDVDWSAIANNHLGILVENEDEWGSTPDAGELDQKPVAKFKYNSGENASDISNEQSFNELMGLYSMFLNLYKNKNNLESYNQCYIAVKELQSKRLQYLYESNKSFESYFRWKLSQLLRFYVRFGTDPARAIVISLYIVFLFGVFFFFFPSDWDVTSKKRMVQNFKDFIQKNDKGYLKPFFILLWGFIISLLNAVTLSLNAFITLGFGNIPTHGIARYFCVLEGFLGWFLLSIFTVALINQVL